MAVQKFKGTTNWLPYFHRKYGGVFTDQMPVWRDSLVPNGPGSATILSRGSTANPCFTSVAQKAAYLAEVGVCDLWRLNAPYPAAPVPDSWTRMVPTMLLVVDEFSTVPNLNLAEMYAGEAVAKARSRFYDQVTRGYVNTDILSVVAEGFESFDYLVHRVGQVAKVATALKHGRFGDALDALGITKTSQRNKLLRGGKVRHKRPARGHEMPLPETRTAVSVSRRKSQVQKPTPRDLAALWLEWRYAIRPLLSDVESLFKALSQRQLPSIKVDGFYISGKVVHVDEAISEYCTAKASARVSGQLIVSDPRGQFMRGLGLNNLAGAVWEVTPYSFMFDWFYDVSSQLKRLANERPTVTFISSGGSVKVESDFTTGGDVIHYNAHSSRFRYTFREGTWGPVLPSAFRWGVGSFVPPNNSSIHCEVKDKAGIKGPRLADAFAFATQALQGLVSSSVKSRTDSNRLVARATARRSPFNSF